MDLTLNAFRPHLTTFPQSLKTKRKIDKRDRPNHSTA